MSDEASILVGAEAEAALDAAFTRAWAESQGQRLARAVDFWQGPSGLYELVSDYLRNGAPRGLLSERQQQAIDTAAELDAAILRHLLPVSVVVWRGVETVRWVLEVVKRDLEGLPGAVVRLEGLTATSVHREVAENFLGSSAGVLLAIELPVGTPGLWLPAWGLAGEGELLLPDRLMVRFLEVSTEGGTLILTGEVAK